MWYSVSIQLLSLAERKSLEEITLCIKNYPVWKKITNVVPQASAARCASSTGVLVEHPRSYYDNDRASDAALFRSVGC